MTDIFTTEHTAVWRSRLASLLFDSARLRLHMSDDVVLLERAVSMAEVLISTIREGRKILIAGNGGSAADAQHFAAELTGRFVTERRPLPAIALTTDTSALTAIGNDYGFDTIFTRQVTALGHPGDSFFGISTSGSSPNVLLATEEAHRLGMRTLALTGRDGGRLREVADIALIIPSYETARIQELHITTIHFLCEAIDEAFTV